MVVADTSFNRYSAIKCLCLELLFFVVLLVVFERKCWGMFCLALEMPCRSFICGFSTYLFWFSHQYPHTSQKYEQGPAITSSPLPYHFIQQSHLILHIFADTHLHKNLLINCEKEVDENKMIHSRPINRWDQWDLWNYWLC